MLRRVTALFLLVLFIKSLRRSWLALLWSHPLLGVLFPGCLSTLDYSTCALPGPPEAEEVGAPGKEKQQTKPSDQGSACVSMLHIMSGSHPSSRGAPS
jgi:hypothetical protein